MSTPPHPVIVLGSDIGAVSTLQTFRRRGVPCWVPDLVPYYARLLGGARYHRIPDLQLAESETVDALIRLSRTMARPPVLMPTYDGYAQLLARHRDAFAEVAFPCTGAAEGVDIVADQRAFGRWADRHVPGLPECRCLDEFTALPDDWQPAVVKRAYHEWVGAAGEGRPLREELRPFTFALIRSPQDLSALRQRAGPFSEYLAIQKHIPGPIENGYSVGLYADRDCRIRTTFVSRKLRGWPLDSGTASSVQNDVVPDAILDQVAMIVGSLRLSGVVEVEYKKDERTGALHLMEINPRCWTWIGITAGTEADIAWSAYQDMIGVEIPAATMNQVPGTRCYAEVLRDGFTALALYRWAAPTRAPGFVEWFPFVASKRTSTLEFRNGDWRMLFALPLETLFAWIGGKIRRHFGRRMRS